MTSTAWKLDLAAFGKRGKRTGSEKPSITAKSHSMPESREASTKHGPLASFRFPNPYKGWKRRKGCGEGCFDLLLALACVTSVNNTVLKGEPSNPWLLGLWMGSTLSLPRLPLNSASITWPRRRAQPWPHGELECPS
jgi:hypothetical protein